MMDMTPLDVMQLCHELQDTFDSIQDGDSFAAMEDLKSICIRLGLPIEDEEEEGFNGEAIEEN